MKRVLTAAALTGASLFFAAAVFAETEDAGSAGGGDATTSSVSGKSGDATKGAAIFSANCAGCHGADASGGRGPNIRGRSAGDVYEAMREGEGGMPTFPGLTKKDAQNIAAFLRNPSAVQSQPPATTPPDATTSNSAPKWKDVGPIFTQSCAGCHKGSKAPMGIKLDNYAHVSANATAALAAIQAGRMPLGGSLSSLQTATIAAWVAAGKPK